MRVHSPLSCCYVISDILENKMVPRRYISKKFDIVVYVHCTPYILCMGPLNQLKIFIIQLPEKWRNRAARRWWWGWRTERGLRRRATVPATSESFRMCTASEKCNTNGVWYTAWNRGRGTREAHREVLDVILDEIELVSDDDGAAACVQIRVVHSILVPFHGIRQVNLDVGAALGQDDLDGGIVDHVVVKYVIHKPHLQTELVTLKEKVEPLLMAVDKWVTFTSKDI